DRVVGLVHAGSLVGVLAPRPAEGLHAAAAVGAVDPPVGHAELELGEGRLGLHHVQGLEQGGGVHAVARPAVLLGPGLRRLTLDGLHPISPFARPLVGRPTREETGPACEGPWERPWKSWTRLRMEAGGPGAVEGELARLALPDRLGIGGGVDAQTAPSVRG